MNPTAGQPLGNALLTANGSIVKQGDHFSFRAVSGCSGNLDEIRLGTSANDVGVLPADSSPPRPNILWITSEDNGRFLGCYGDPVARTPHLDNLASQGLRYTRAYSNGAVCAVSRNCLLTGVPSVARGNSPMRSKYRIPQEFTSDYYSKRLSAAGYYVTNDNKDDFNISNSQVVSTEVWDDKGPNAHYRNRPANSPFFTIINLGTTHEGQVSRGIHSTFLNGDPLPNQSAIDAVQPPYEVENAATLVDWQQMYGDLERMDNQVGDILAELAAEGLADSTIVVYCSDHGGILTRSKRYLYDSGTRVPMIVFVPPALQHLAPTATGTDLHGDYTDRLVQFLDMPYTWLTLAGVTPPAEMTGTAFLAETPDPAPETVFLFMDRADEGNNFVRGVTDGQFKYIRNYNPDRPIFMFTEFALSVQPGQEGQWHEFARGNTSPEHSALFAPRPPEELYDTEADPHEVNNLAALPSHASTLAAMRVALDNHMLSNRDTGLLPEALMEAIDSSASDTIHSWAQSETNFPVADLLTLANAAAMQNPENIPLFRSAVEDSNELIRYWGAMGLRLLGKNARPALDAVETALADSSAHVRLPAAVALARLGQRERALNDYILPELTSGAPLLEYTALDAMALLDANEDYRQLSAAERPTGDIQTRLGERLLFGGTIYRQKLVQYTQDNRYPGSEIYPDHDGDGVASYPEILEDRNPHDASDYGSEFKENNNFEGWTATGISGTNVGGSRLSGTVIANSSRLTRNDLSFSASSFDNLLLRIKTSTNGLCKLQWTTEQDGTYNNTKELTTTYTGGGADQLLSFPCAADSAWTGTITGIRIFPSDQSGATFEIDWVLASSGDRDEDGLADALEGLEDPDGDGLENFRDLDSDGNGLSDEVEIEHGLDPYLPEANLDSDGDGVLDFDEMIAGTSLTQPSDFWQIQIRIEPEGNVISIPTEPGRFYLLETSYDLKTWFPIEEFAGEFSQVVELEDTLPAPGQSGFYRARGSSLPRTLLSP